jgi:superfamily II DNA/RNA helicase
MQGQEDIAQAHSGTVKTATFSIAMLQFIDGTVREMQTLALSPTHDHIVQVCERTLPGFAH